MNIALLEPLNVDKEYIDKLVKNLKNEGYNFTYYESKSSNVDELIRRSANQDVVIIANTPYPKEVIESTDTLKLISVAFTGIDHIDVNLCKEKNIMICNASGYANQTVAELIIGMTISALRNIKTADLTVRASGINSLSGGEIAGKTVGIIGLGKIGLKTANLYKAFGANVIAYNRSQSQEIIDLGIEYKELDDVLSESDIISLNLPLNEHTKGLISADKMALMKKTAIFVNCARGPIVDNIALANALNEDRLAFACIDVFDMEPPIPADYPLLHAKNTLLTPHIAFVSQESMIRRANIAFANVEGFLNGQPINVCK